MASSCNDLVAQCHYTEGACVHCSSPFARQPNFGTTEYIHFPGPSRGLVSQTPSAFPARAPNPPDTTPRPQTPPPDAPGPHRPPQAPTHPPATAHAGALPLRRLGRCLHGADLPPLPCLGLGLPSHRRTAHRLQPLAHPGVVGSGSSLQLPPRLLPAALVLLAAGAGPGRMGLRPPRA